MPTPSLERPTSRAKAQAVPAELRQQVLARVATMVELGNTAWAQLGKPPMPRPTVAFDLRGRAAGEASMKQTASGLVLRHLRINADLLQKNTAEVVEQTVPHEVAHLLTWHYFGKVDPHGDEWARVMRSLGREPNRLHSMEVEPARVEKREFIYRCACKQHELTLRRHKKVLLGKNSYGCPSCNQVLRFVSGPDVDLPLQVSRPRSVPPPSWVKPGGPGAAPRPAYPAPANTLTKGNPAAPRAQDDAKKPHPDSPTQKQLTFARDLAVRKGVSLPPSALLNRKSLSDWIGRTSLLKDRS